MKYHFEKIRPYLPLFTKPCSNGMPAPWLQIIKEGMKLRGVDAGYCRKPVISELPSDVKTALKTTLKEYGYLS